MSAIEEILNEDDDEDELYTEDIILYDTNDLESLDMKQLMNIE